MSIKQVPRRLSFIPGGYLYFLWGIEQMKARDIENSLDLMSVLIKNLKISQDLKDLIGYYDFMKNNSGYYFSGVDPNDMITSYDEFLGDIERIRESIQDAINENGKELEL